MVKVLTGLKLNKKFSCSSGMSLLEVLLALLILSVILSMTLPLLTAQWISIEKLKYRLDLQNSMLNSQRIITESLQTAKTVEWTSGGILKIKSWKDPLTTDLYYIADKDYDGIFDLYREHLNVVNPLVSGVRGWECTQLEGGLWEVKINGQISDYQETIKFYTRQK